MSSPHQPYWAPPQLRQQRSELSRLIEPGDLLGPTSVAALGPARAHELIFSGRRPTSEEQQTVAAAALEAGLDTSRVTLVGGLERWRTRIEQANGERDLRVLHRLGGGLIIPEDDAWPAQLNDLYPAVPLGLYFRGTAPAADADPEQNYLLALKRLPVPPRSISVVGSREMSDYGARATFELAEQLAGHGVSILSGGAYGIDAAAHRGALYAERDESGPSPTCAVLAGGVDRFYPAGNERLLRAVTDQGLLLSEMALVPRPPGTDSCTATESLPRSPQLWWSSKLAGAAALSPPPTTDSDSAELSARFPAASSRPAHRGATGCCATPRPSWSPMRQRSWS